MIIQPRSVFSSDGASTLAQLFGSALVTEYDARDLTTLFKDTAGTQPVTTALDHVNLWKNKLGVASKDLQSTGTDGGLWNGSSGYNGLPQVVFDAATFKLLYGDFTLAQPCQLFVVMGTISPLVDNGTLWDGGNGGNTMRCFWTSGQGTDSLGTYAGGFGPTITNRQDDTLVQCRMLYSGAASTFKYNGGSVATGDTSTGTAGGLTLAAFGNRGVGFQKIGYSYFAITNRAATAGENTQAELILRTAFGLGA